MTRHNFWNDPHTDNDGTTYAWGSTALVDNMTGNIVRREHGHDCVIDGAYFFMDEYPVGFCYDSADIVESIWLCKSFHHTGKSTTKDRKGNTLDAKKAPITRFASSCQISEKLGKLGGKIPALIAELGDDWLKAFKHYSIEISKKAHCDFVV